MASTITNGLQKALNVNGSSSNAKLADLAKDTVNVEDKNARITTDFGMKVSNTDNWLTVSTDDRLGPALLEDVHGREKVRMTDTTRSRTMLIDPLDPQVPNYTTQTLSSRLEPDLPFRFDHERIPERVVHARGVGAFGTFKLFESAADVTKAGVLTDTSRTTPIFVRFSTVLGSRGSADTVRDVRGFAIKFYTEEGNWDIVANDIPVFFIQDAMKFPDLSQY